MCEAQFDFAVACAFSIGYPVLPKDSQVGVFGNHLNLTIISLRVGRPVAPKKVQSTNLYIVRISSEKRIIESSLVNLIVRLNQCRFLCAIKFTDPDVFHLLDQPFYVFVLTTPQFSTVVC